MRGARQTTIELDTAHARAASPAVPMVEGVVPALPVADKAGTLAGLDRPGRRLAVAFRLRHAHPSRWPSAVRRALEEERAFGHPFLFTPLLIAFGSILSFSAGDPPGLHESAALACVFCMAALMVRHHPGPAGAFIRILAALSLGAAFAAIETARTATVMLDSPVTTTITGEVVSREITGRNAYRYVVALRGTDTPHLRRPPKTVTLLARNAGQAAGVGDSVSGRARLSPPSGPALRGLNDFGFDSFFRGIGAVGYVYGKLVVVPGIPRQAGGVIEAAKTRIAAWREAIGLRIRAAVPGDAGAIAAALVTAEERAIGRPTIEALRNSGLGHVLAISGLNMVLAAGTLLVGLRTGLSLVPGLAHRVPIKKFASAGALLMVCFYILISGGAVSAVRSWIMIVIMLVAVFFDRPSISLRNVAVAALIILAVNPSAVSGPGFQMSFAATLALVAGYGRWRDRDPPATAPKGTDVLGSVRGFLAGLFVSSVIGGVSTMVYSAAHFSQLPAFGLLGNMLAMPVIGIVVMPAGLIAMLLMPIGLDTLPLIVMGSGIEVMMAVARFVSSIGGQVPTGRMPDAAFALIAVGGLVLCLLRTWLALSGTLLVAAGAVVVLATPAKNPALVIAEDGRLVALIDGATGSSNRVRPPAFIYDQWTRSLRLDRHVAPLLRPDLALPDPSLPEAVPAGSGPRDRPPFDPLATRTALRQLIEGGTAGRFACVRNQWCAATSRQGWVVVVVEDRRLIGAACDQATIVVTAASPLFATCRSGALLASARLLRRSGALEITPHERSPGGMTIVGALDGLGRPWQRHRTYDWRQDAFTQGDETSGGEADEES